MRTDRSVSRCTSVNDFRAVICHRGNTAHQRLQCHQLTDRTNDASLIYALADRVNGPWTPAVKRSPRGRYQSRAASESPSVGHIDSSGVAFSKTTWYMALKLNGDGQQIYWEKQQKIKLWPR